jgi:chromosomal replication initiation ATPase DnaA
MKSPCENLASSTPPGPTLPFCDSSNANALRERVRARLRERFAQTEESILRVLDARLRAFETAAALDLDLRFNADTGLHETFNAIASYVCAEFSETQTALFARCKEPGIAIPRMLAMTLCRRITGATLKIIGAHFSRDHGTVLNAMRQIDNRCATNPVFAKQVARMEAELRRDFSLEQK